LSGREGGNDSPFSTSRRRSFRLSTIDFLTKRLLLAASRTGTFGDAYFVVRDLFGGDEVEVVPSRSVSRMGRSVRPGSIEITVRLASLTIKCHGSFDVYPKSLVGDCEPLIQLHTTTTETIGLQEVRAVDALTSPPSATGRCGIQDLSIPSLSLHGDDCYDSDDDYDEFQEEIVDDGSENDNGGSSSRGLRSLPRQRQPRRRADMVVQERITDRTGWRHLSIRPALYEKHEEFSTPS
jgi:hypothetical protein